MENLALQMPVLDLFGEQVIIRQRSSGPRRQPAQFRLVQELEQLAFIDILGMSDEELEKQRQLDGITDDYIDWLRGFILKRTLRQLLHSQTNEDSKREAYEWLMADDVHPFSFRVCCEAYDSDYTEVRQGVESILRKHAFN